jgi:TetR/AcrR family transcriptional repressor of nem operon
MEQLKSLRLFEIKELHTAELTKGSFFHHVSTKEELAIAAADYWSEVTSALFASAPSDTLELVLA